MVHILTKKPVDTQGLLLSTTFGENERSYSARQGGTLGENGHYRAWARYAEHDGIVDSQGKAHHPSDWLIATGGMRADWDLGDGVRTEFLMQGHSASVGETLFLSGTEDPLDFRIIDDDTPRNGMQLMGAWEKTRENGRTDHYQAWYTLDHQKQIDFPIEIHTFDLEYQGTREISESHSLNFGAGMRHMDADFGGDFVQQLVPDSFELSTFRVFAVDQHTISDWDLTVFGSANIEYNELTYLEIQPSVRFVWAPSEKHTLWGSASRAVRGASLEELSLTMADGPDDNPWWMGAADFDKEEMYAYELGYRSQLASHLVLDVTGFYNTFDDLSTVELGEALGEDGFPFFFYTYGNMGEADSTGVELAIDWDPRENWRLRSAYTYFDIEFSTEGGSFLPGLVADWDKLVPHNWVSVRSYYDVSDNLEFDLSLYWMDDLGYFDNSQYARWDARIEWRPKADLAFFLGVQNAQDRYHPEAGEDVIDDATEVEQNIYFGMRWSR